jgi:ornithine decarboxylase
MEPEMILEPGRGIVANAFVLVATIIAKVVRSDHAWLFLDAGCYNGLFEAMAYQGSTRYHVSSLRESTPETLASFALAGPTGDGPDIITRQAMLPHDISVGEKLVIHNVGAYSLSVTSRFNGFPKPEVHFA